MKRITEAGSIYIEKSVKLLPGESGLGVALEWNFEKNGHFFKKLSQDLHFLRHLEFSLCVF